MAGVGIISSHCVVVSNDNAQAPVRSRNYSTELHMDDPVCYRLKQYDCDFAR